MPGPSKPRHLEETQTAEEKECAKKRAKEIEQRGWEQAIAMQERLDLKERRRQAAEWDKEQLVNPAPNPLLLPRENLSEPSRLCPVCKKQIARKNFINHLETSKICLRRNGKTLESVKKEIRAEKARENYEKNKETERARSQNNYQKNAEAKKRKSRETYEADPEPKKAKVRENYENNPEPKKSQMREARAKEYKENPDKEKRRMSEAYEADPEPKRAKVRENYENNPEPKKSQMREARAKEYNENPDKDKQRMSEAYKADPEPKKGQMREAREKEYRENPVLQKEKMQRIYEKRKNTLTSLKSLREFRNRAVHGPIFLCVYCSEFNFKSNVFRVNATDVEESEYIDHAYRIKHCSDFSVLDSYWSCLSCLRDVRKGKLPKSSMVNIPADETEERFQNFTDVENCLIAPVIVFVKLHNIKNKLQNANKIVACPVSTDTVFENLRSLQKGMSMATLVRSAEYDRKVYSGQVRPSLIRDCINYIVSKGYRHYGSNQHVQNLARSIANMDLVHEHGNESLEEDFVASEDVERDAIDRQRVRLDCVATAFLPDKASRKFSPAADGEVLNMTRLRDPYSQMFPPRFPSGIDIHREFARPVTESDYINHLLRSIDPWFSQNPLFVFTAAYRLDFQKIASSLHAVKGNFSSNDVSNNLI